MGGVCLAQLPLAATCPFSSSSSLQAVEAKEGMPVSPENYTTASVSYQSLFGYYRRLAGMTVGGHGRFDGATAKGVHLMHCEYYPSV